MRSCSGLDLVMDKLLNALEVETYIKENFRHTIDFDDADRKAGTSLYDHCYETLGISAVIFIRFDQYKILPKSHWTWYAKRPRFRTEEDAVMFKLTFNP
jgi:hypothetical protein